MPPLRSLRLRLAIAATFALVLAALIAVAPPIQPQTASAQCSYGCGTSPFYGNGYNSYNGTSGYFGGTGYNGVNGYNGYNGYNGTSSYYGSGSCGSSYCGSTYGSYGNGCQQVLFSQSGCVGSGTTTTGGQSCAALTLSFGQSCSNGVVTCAQGTTTCANSGYSITSCPTTFTTPQCTAATTAASTAPLAARTAPAPQPSTSITCPGGGYAQTLANCGTGATLTAAGTGASPTTASALPQTGFQVSLASGWNLIAGPAGTTLPGSGLLTFQAGDTTYETIAAGTPFKSGVGYWAFLPAATQITLSAASGGSTTVNLPAGQPVMVGNPGNTPATITGADSVFIFTPGSSTYTTGTQLQPGQGAWAMSTNGSQATIVNAPSSQSTSVTAPGS